MTVSGQSCSWTAQVAGGQEPACSLPLSLLFSPQAEPGTVFTLLITGEGPADRRAITESPQAPGLGTLQTPAAVSQMRRQRPAVTREPSLAELEGPKRDIKDMRGNGRVGTDGGGGGGGGDEGGGGLEKPEWEAGGLAKVSFKAKWGLDSTLSLLHTHTHTVLQTPDITLQQFIL